MWCGDARVTCRSADIALVFFIMSLINVVFEYIFYCTLLYDTAIVTPVCSFVSVLCTMLKQRNLLISFIVKTKYVVSTKLPLISLTNDCTVHSDIANSHWWVDPWVRVGLGSTGRVRSNMILCQRALVNISCKHE